VTAVTESLSPPVRIFAVLGVIAALGFGAFTFLMGSGDAALDTPITTVTRERPATPSKPTATPATPTRPATRTPQAVETASGFPRPINRALSKKQVVVVAVYLPRARVDLSVRAEAKRAARATGAGFVALSALDENVMSGLVAKAGVLPAPAVLVVKRPGVVTSTLGVVDGLTISEAVVQARR
jgi:hypothetical protein